MTRPNVAADKPRAAQARVGAKADDPRLELKPFLVLLFLTGNLYTASRGTDWTDNTDFAKKKSVLSVRFAVSEIRVLIPLNSVEPLF